MNREEKEVGDEVRRRLIQQANTKLAIRNSRLKMMAVLFSVVFFAVAALQAIAIAFFTRGFLLSRQVLDSASSLEDSIFTRADELQQFDNAVIIVIDALRFDFVIPHEQEAYYHNHLTTPYEIFLEQPENSLLLKFIADPPTTTLQRLKGLTTGSLPTFIDAGSNFDGDVIEEDNLIKQLFKHNRNLAFVGDDTWQALFGPFLNVSYPYDSLNVWDLHTVDNGVIEHLLPLMESKPDVLIGHLLGVDHCGHRYGPDHYAMKEKQIQMNKFLKDVIAELDDNTLLVLMGDHGMDHTGNHGGDSPDELEATLWMYSKRKSFKRLPSENYDISNNGKNYRQVNQIDLVPTLSLLLGIPIPFNNLGFPIEEVFPKKEQYELASYLTIEQIQRYRQESTTLQNDEKINEKYALIRELWSDGNPTPDFLKEAIAYQTESLERCKDLWARFDLFSIGIGITLLAISFLILITYSKLVPSVVISQLSEEIVPSVIAMVALFTVIFVAISLILNPSFLPLPWFALLGSAIGIIFGFIIPIFDRYSPKWLFISFLEIFRSGFWSAVGITFMIIHALVFASNSFTIWEDRITSYLLITFGFLAAFRSLNCSKKFDRITGVYHSVSFMVMTRLATLITLCREEQGAQCKPTFKLTGWVIMLLFVNSFYLSVIIKAFYNIKSSYQSAAPLWNNVFKVLLLMISLYWTVEYFEHNQSNYRLLKSIDLKSLHFAKFTLARIVTGVSLIAANFGWSRGPLCVKLDVKTSETSSREACILGYGNVYGSEYFLLVMNFIAAIFLFTKPMGQLSLFLLVNQVLSLLEIVKILELRSSIISPVILGLLGMFFFFASGHQATIPSINWEIGFALTETIRFPFTHVAIILNTFGSFIIITLSIALLTLWGIPPTFKPIALYSKIVENCGMLLIYQTLITLSSLIFAAFFRRHLMVWKIFAPRFMFAGLVLIAMDVVLFLLTIGFGCGRLIIQINRIFGK